jgi:hypothetical protein
MEETIITWNFTNWITIVLMVIIMFFALSLVSQAWHNKMGTSPSKVGSF